MNGRRPLNPETIEYALHLATQLREQDRALPDIIVCHLEPLAELLDVSGYRNGPVTDYATDDKAAADLWGKSHLFGMRILIDTAVPPGEIEFREALRLL